MYKVYATSILLCHRHLTENMNCERHNQTISCPLSETSYARLGGNNSMNMIWAGQHNLL